MDSENPDVQVANNTRDLRANTHTHTHTHLWDSDGIEKTNLTLLETKTQVRCPVILFKPRIYRKKDKREKDISFYLREFETSACQVISTLNSSFVQDD